MREKTNSITHLVKMVAAEVFKEEFERREKERIIHKASMRDMENRLCQAISTNVEKAGRPWSEEEDSLLLQELKTAVAQIALNHKRSRGAISSRIRQKELVKNY